MSAERGDNWSREYANLTQQHLKYMYTQCTSKYLYEYYTINTSKQCTLFHVCRFSFSPIPANFRYTYYATAVANGGEAEWDFFWQVYQNATVAVERRKCLYALGQTRQPWLLKRYVNIEQEVFCFSLCASPAVTGRGLG